jgi:tetratricopeptide (TPR) repeat protein
MKIFSLNLIVSAIFFTLLCSISVSCPASDESVYHNIDKLLFQGENQQAWLLLQQMPKNNINNEEISWRMARTQYEMGRLEESETNAFVLFQNAERYARETIEEAPNKNDGYKWLAIALGAQAKYADTETQVRQSREIKESIEKAIELDPDDDIAYLVLSRWHYKISSLGFFARTFANLVYGELPKASLEKAEELLLQAIGLHDRISHRYNLAKVYDRMGRQEDVKMQYQKAILLPVTFPEELEELEKARKRLQNWE